MIWAGAGVLWIAAAREVANPQNYDPNGWRVAYLVMAASMAVGFITVLFSRDGATPRHPRKTGGDGCGPRWSRTVCRFFRRFGWNALLVLALIATYRVSDIVMGIMANPFYVDMGYSKDEVAAVSKVYGLVMTS